MKEAKQVIVMRKDLGMRKGKMIAQGAHASISWLVECTFQTDKGEVGRRVMTDAEIAWINGSFTKICVGVESEEELLVVHKKALDAGLTSQLITDKGLTEFAEVPTKTCCAIGPEWCERIDAITGNLQLL